VKSILVICEGNICRSPMAQGLLAAALPQASVQSAGLGALIGRPADDTAIKLMRERNIDIGAHRATQLSNHACVVSDLIFVMDTEQRQRVEALYPHTRGRVFRIGEYANSEIPDPFRQDEAVFRSTLSLLESSVDLWLSRIRRL
jgi:protein-tyrosine phosphatase